MIVQTLTIDGPTMTKTTESPRWEDIKAAIFQLDGDRYPSIGLWIKDEIGMQILGGFNGVFICEIIKENENLYLIKPELPTDEALCPVKSEGPIYPVFWKCSREEVLNVAKFFSLNGAENPEFTWYSD